MSTRLRVKIMRKKLNVTQSEFADRVGVSLAYVKMIETGAKPLSSKFIRAACAAYNVREEWLRKGAGAFLVEIPPPLSSLASLKQELAVALFRQLDQETRAAVVQEMRARLYVEMVRRYRASQETRF